MRECTAARKGGPPLFAIAALAALAVSLPSGQARTSPSDFTFFSTRLPRWLPVPSVPADNPISEEKVALGRWLFYDVRLSGNGTFSCASCHQQARAFTDGRQVALGSTGGAHTRSTLSLTNVAYNSSFGWDDQKLTSLEAQMQVPMYNEHPIELGLKGREKEVLARFSTVDVDLQRFRAAFPGQPDPVSLPHIVRAIASFERVLLSGRSPFDRYLYEDDRSQMTDAALRGLSLFFSDRLRCSECHGTFNLSGPVRFEGSAPAPPLFHNTGLTASVQTFRAPTLRNIAMTAPYMHDGSIATLRDVVRHYASGGVRNLVKSDRLQGFAISPSETDDVLGFLESLTDEEFLTNPALGDPHIK